MGLTSILRGFSAMLLVLGAAMAPPYIVALANGEEGAGAFLFGMIAAFLTGGGAYAASIGARSPTDFRGALIIILLWWAGIPIFAAIPLLMTTQNYADAYFEAVTALTTTGGWLSNTAAIASPAGMLWRAELQWLGGLASIAIAAAIFIRPAFIGIDTLLPPFPRGEKDSFLRPLRNATVTFGWVYVIITLGAFAALAIAGAPTPDAFLIALSGVASGGFLPNAGGVEAYAPAVGAVLFFIIIFSGANFIVIARIFRGARQRVRDVESGAYLIMILVVGVLFWLLSRDADLFHIVPQIFNAASFLSTNGFVLGESPPLIAVLVTTIIGGAAVSTAGGFKILRWLVIMERAKEEIRRLIAPNAVFSRQRVSNELGVWIHFLVFTMTLAILVVAISVSGHPFEIAAAAATATLANAGPLLSLAEGAREGYAIFEPSLRWLLLIAMILGRLEAAVALALFNRAFWRFM